jgi:hypothetical protein
MSWQVNQRRNESRVSNPFGGGFGTANTVAFGSFGQFSSPGPFVSQPHPHGPSVHSGSRPSPFSTNPRIQTGTFPSSKGGKGKGNTNLGATAASQMQDEANPVVRVSNPFAAIGVASSPGLSLDDAISQYKTEYIRKGGYPFSCYGLAEEAPVITGDISPAELRWYLTRENPDILNALSQRSQLLDEDFTEFLKGGLQGLSISLKRSGPYRIPDPAFPAFVPRGELSLLVTCNPTELSDSDRFVFQSRTIADESPIPSHPPPLELR